MKTCKEISEILCQDQELSLLKRTELKMHLLMCGNCSAYAAHLKMMRDGFRKLFSKLTELDKSKVKDLEAQVIEKINKKN